MSKCKTIDRLALTRQSSRLLNSNEAPTPEAPERFRVEPVKPVQHGDICPKCGQHTLHHVEGCETCSSCGYSACSYVW